ncbi:alpha-L-rhamnosidase (plasmid) [Granulicella tundricola MP5ACTX9]|uniref:Alpha-L-rhamnosidase n=2 Tax=Granulicella TaxID=940557 RepID=E8X712_GRATM|nr:alpha-L-rhamnosidase [Granulicella tundricola MP5ACTX9]
MPSLWTRRRFLSHSSASALLAAHHPSLLAGQAARPQSAATSPEEIAGSVRGLMHGKTERPLRYRPEQGGFTIRNSSEFFNRPLYGQNIAFRVDAGDLPEFSLYMPGHGGNLRLGFTARGTAKWLSQADEIVATYHAGRMSYTINDAALGSNQLRLDVVTAAQGPGLHIRVQSTLAKDEVQMLYAFAGASGRKGKRGGDIGCESEPVSQFFQVRPMECAGNNYTIEGHTARLTSKAVNLSFDFPPGTTALIGDASRWNDGWQALADSAASGPALPALLASVKLSATPLHLRINGDVTIDAEEAYVRRCAQLDAVASRVSLQTPDPFINAIGPAVGIAGDALWDEAQHCVMHGAVAWRNPLAGWRGPYVLDALGWHDRFIQHARHWIAKQNIAPVTTAVPAIGQPDPGSHLSRTENLLHSNGDLSHNHYDMNLVFFDALLRHLQWTADLAFAAEIWPALERHLAWEQRLFRRLYDGLPLYEAYACIWASDNLQYNGGGATHSTAYNLFANRMAAQIAAMIQKDPAPYEREATLIQKAMQTHLWIGSQGTYAESKDLLGPQAVYTSPALWSVYHAIDSRAATPRQSWQMAVERLSAIRSVPVSGLSVPPGGTMLSCSDWLPYEWSLNLLLLAENMHMALALWQTGMVDEAYSLFKGNLLDSMFQGLCPGNFHMTSQLDAHRQEAQRDFGDPIGITARALIEGLFGVQPDLLHNTLHITPGFPSDWNNASLHHPDLDLAWTRTGNRESCEITSRLGRPVALSLKLRAPSTGQPRVSINGTPATGAFIAEAVGAPSLHIQAQAQTHWTVAIEWKGPAAAPRPAHRIVHRDDIVFPPSQIIDDPQRALNQGRATRPGTHTVFTQAGTPDCQWWMPHTFLVLDPSPAPATQPLGTSRPIDLTAHLNSSITEIFERDYASPRSPYCSLSIPQQGIGAWAAFDRRPSIDDTGLRSLNGELRIPYGPTFRTPGGAAPNCLYLSHWQQDKPTIRIPLKGSAKMLSLLLAGSTFPQCSRTDHAHVHVSYTDGTRSSLTLRNPENWWPIEQDYLIDDYLFVDETLPPTRVDLKTGKVRSLTQAQIQTQIQTQAKGNGGHIPGGAATVLHIPLDPSKTLSSLEITVHLYGIIVALLAATLISD